MAENEGPHRFDKTGRALVTRLECGDTIVERASNFCTSSLNVAHMFMHASAGQDFTITITAREMTSEEYDAMRTAFEESAQGEIMAMQMVPDLAAAAAGTEGGEST